jgi:hypothetical protein
MNQAEKRQRPYALFLPVFWSTACDVRVTEQGIWSVKIPLERISAV